MPSIIAADIIGVQDMTWGHDPRFSYTGIKQLSLMSFGLYKDTGNARNWLEEMPLSYGLLRETNEGPGQIFSLRIKYASGPSTTTSQNLNEIWTVTFHNADEAALFKLTWL